MTRKAELPDLPSKGDLTDWVAKMGDRETAAERLAVLIENTDEYTPPQKATMEDAVLEAVSFTRLELPPKRIFLEPWLTEQSITLISGWRGMGKTWLALSMLDAISRGEPFGPWKMVESVPCLYLDGEMPVQDVQERLSMLGTPAKRKNQLYIYSDAYANSLGLARVNLLSESFRSKMQAILLARGVKLWAVDNLASLTKGIDENSKKDWDPINSWLLDLRFLGIATVLLHHTNKSGGQRGTSAREDNIDCSIMLKQSYDYTPEDGARFITSFQKARVRTQDLRAIADTQFQLTEDQAGRLVWSYGDVRKEAKLEILRLLDEGHSQSEVKEILGIDKGYISRIRKQAIKDGYMTTKNKLSQAGYKLVHEEITD
jgi:putative DNA primase/helicase